MHLVGAWWTEGPVLPAFQPGFSTLKLHIDFIRFENEKQNIDKNYKRKKTKLNCYFCE